MTGQAETTRATATQVPLLSLSGIVKQFPGCLANNRVDLVVSQAIGNLVIRYPE